MASPRPRVPAHARVLSQASQPLPLCVPAHVHVCARASMALPSSPAHPALSFPFPLSAFLSPYGARGRLSLTIAPVGSHPVHAPSVPVFPQSTPLSSLFSLSLPPPPPGPTVSHAGGSTFPWVPCSLPSRTPATRAPRHSLVPRTPTPSPSAHGCHLLLWPPFSLHPACCGRFTSRCLPPPSPCPLLSAEGPSSACRPRPSACLLLRDSSPQERGAPPVGHFPPFSGAQHAYALRGRRNGTNPPHAL